jgi:ADP-ribosyl-[dinitrogen reductase] hydrolase
MNAKAVIKYAAKVNRDSLSNGCLMRITPLAVWTHRLSDADLDKAVRIDAGLTHPHETAQQVCVCYCIAIKHLLINLGDRQGAFQALR